MFSGSRTSDHAFHCDSRIVSTKKIVVLVKEGTGIIVNGIKITSATVVSRNEWHLRKTASEVDGKK